MKWACLKYPNLCLPEAVAWGGCIKSFVSSVAQEGLPYNLKSIIVSITHNHHPDLITSSTIYFISFEWEIIE